MVPERIHDLIVSRRPEALCDDCIQHALQLKNRQQVQPVTITLALTRDFFREMGACSTCDMFKKVIRSTAPR